jgi:hypothetical protein
MAETRVQFRRIEPSYVSAYRSEVMQDLERIAYERFFEEFEVRNLPGLADSEKEYFRQSPETFLRNLLAESGFDPINTVVVRGDPEDCLKVVRDEATGLESHPHLTHIKPPSAIASTYAII